MPANGALLFLLFGLIHHSQAQTTLYVSPTTGSDSNPGTAADAPLASVAGAVRVLRHKNAATSLLLSGRLQLNETATIPPSATGLTIAQWPGQDPAVLSGGEAIPASSWTKKAPLRGTSSSTVVWSAPLSAAAAAALSQTSAGSIFVNGVRRNIVRTPTLRWKRSLGATGSAVSKQARREDETVESPRVWMRARECVYVCVCVCVCAPILTRVYDIPQGFVVAASTLDAGWSLDAASLAQWRVGAFHSWTKAFHTVKSVAKSKGSGSGSGSKSDSGSDGSNDEEYTIMFGERALFGYGEYTYCSDYRFYIEGIPEMDLTPGSWRLVPAMTASRGTAQCI
jgi:hypothetical protein